MTSEYQKVHTDFLYDKFNEDSLKATIEANETITTELEYIRSKENVETQVITVTFGFAAVISNDEQTELNSIVANHDGEPPLTMIFHASSNLVESEKVITATDPSWSELGVSVTNPSAFTKNVSATKGRVIGLVRSNGTGAKIRIREDTTEPSGGYDVPNTGGQWIPMQWFAPDTPTAGGHIYTLEGQLPTSGATEVAVKGTAVSLLEFV